MNKLLTRGALALALLLVAVPVTAQQLWKWSTTSATNSTADPAISWVTGMAPSQVSPSSRAMMASVARWRDDTSGLLIALGTSTALTVTTNQGLSATPNDGQMIAIRLNFGHAAGVTLAADGGTAFPIQSTIGVPLPVGTLVPGSPYTVMFRAATNVWLLRDFHANPSEIPVGGIIDYVGTTAPNSNFALPAGQCISRTTYAALFALAGTAFGACDGSTTFGLPDLRGRVVAGLDNLNGSAANRITAAGGNFDGTVLGGTGGSQNSTLTTAQIPSHTHGVSITSAAAGTHSHTASGTTDVENANHTHTGTTSSDGAHTHTVGNPGNLFLAQVPSGGIATLSGAGFNIGAAATDNASVAHTHTITTGGISANHAHFFNPTLSTQADHTHLVSGTSAATGGGASHPIVQPTMTLGKLIRIL